MRNLLLTVLFLFTAAVPDLSADAAILLAEPYGFFGSMSPTGHAAVYLDRVCAESPVKLRRCGPGESGVVISRYSKIAGFDWIAIPLIPYLYAVERAESVPDSADTETVALLRNTYREQHLRQLVPDSPTGQIPKGEWYQLVGAAYDRKIYAFEIETTEAQDTLFVEAFNSRRNESHFNLLFGNCADFARNVINFYYPHALRRSIIADVGMTTPKHIAQSMVRYSKKHPELEFHVFVIPQIPGNRPPSKKNRGVLEALVRSKKYAVPLVAINLWLAPVCATGYVTTGRFRPERYVQKTYDPSTLEARALSAQERSRSAQNSVHTPQLQGSQDQGTATNRNGPSVRAANNQLE